MDNYIKYVITFGILGITITAILIRWQLAHEASKVNGSTYSHP